MEREPYVRAEVNLNAELIIVACVDVSDFEQKGFVEIGPISNTNLDGLNNASYGFQPWLMQRVKAPEPDGWFIALKDAKTGKESELLIMRDRKSAEEWRDKGYIIKPFIYLDSVVTISLEEAKQQFESK